MRIRDARLAVGVVSVGVALAGTVTWAAADGGDGGRGDAVSERLSGYEEDPLVLSTTGQGTFRANVDAERGEVAWTLRYSSLEGAVTQAHIHLGGEAQSGMISAFLCSNLTGAPAGTQPCPPAPAVVSGVIRAVDVIGPAAQGIAPGELDELLAALRAEKTYVNVHSEKYPGGEIRAQIDHKHG